MSLSDSDHGVPLWAIVFNLIVLTLLLYQCFQDIWYVLTSWLFAIPLTFGLVFIQWFGASMDRALNPWVERLDLDLWSMFTTKHYNAWLYFTDSKAWFSQGLLVLPSISLLFVTILLSEDIMGAVLMLGDFVLALLLLVLVHIRWERVINY